LLAKNIEQTSKSNLILFQTLGFPFSINTTLAREWKPFVIFEIKNQKAQTDNARGMFLY